MTNATAYVLAGQDIQARYFDSAPRGTICPKCASCLNTTYRPANMRVEESRRYDFGHTRDLQPLFSQSLVDIIIEATGYCMEAIEIPGSGGYFQLPISEIVKFDAQRRKTRFGPECDLCGHFQWIAGATPAFLICTQIPPNSIFRTDLAFGDKNGRTPLLIVGRELKEKIERRSFGGVYFNEAYGSNEKYKNDKVH